MTDEKFLDVMREYPALNIFVTLVLCWLVASGLAINLCVIDEKIRNWKRRRRDLKGSH